MNLTGTFEGYIPSVTDLYYRGTNQGGFTSPTNYVTFYLDHITLIDTAQDKNIVGSNYFNFAGHYNLNIEGTFCNGATGQRILTLYRGKNTGCTVLQRILLLGQAVPAIQQYRFR